MTHWFYLLVCSLVFSAGAATADFELGPYQISGKDGAILSGGVLKNCRDEYVLTLRDRQLNGNEGFDSVTAAESGPDRLELKCENRELGLRIDKLYTYDAATDTLRKTVTASGPEGFWEYRTDVKVDPKFRSGSYYHKPVWHNADPSRTPAQGVTRAIREVGFISLVNLVNPEQNRTLSVYRTAINGEPVFPYGGVGAARGGLILNRNGWSQVNVLAAIAPEQPASVTVAYQCSTGDEFDFYGAFIARPEIADLRGPDAVGWPERMIAEGGWDPSYLNQLPQLRQLSDRLPWGTVYAWTLWGWFAPYYGDYAGRIEDAAPGTRDPREIRDLFRELREKLPAGNIKFGCYILPGAFSRSSKVAQEHPDWLNHQPDGTPVNGCFADYAPDDPTYTYSIRRGALEHWRDRILGIFAEVKPDYLYIDGGIAGAVIPDWRTMSCDQDTDWYELWRMFQQLCQDAGGALLSNQSASVYNDGGYHEFNWYPLYAQDWRAFTNRVLTAVIFRGADRRVALVGYVWNGKPDNPATRLQINSYFTLNTGSSFLDVKGDNHFPAIDYQLPYLLAAYELFPSEAATDAAVTPDWRDEAVELEVHAFRCPAGGRLGVMNHAAAATPTELGVSTRELGLKADLPLYVWQHTLLPQPDAGSKLAGKADLPRIFTTELIAACATTPERFTTSIALAQELAAVLILTNSPVLLTGVDHQELPLPLPAALGIRSSGVANRSEQSLSVNLDSETFSGEALALLPDFLTGPVSATIQPADAANTTVAAGPQPLELRETSSSGRRAVAFEFPAGRSSIVIRPRQ